MASLFSSAKNGVSQMADKIHELPNANLVNGEPDPDVIADIQRLLQDAKSGKLRMIAFVAYDHARHFTHGIAGTSTLTEAIGAAEFLKLQLFMSNTK